MKICATNHYETHLEADAYFAFLIASRPLLRPDMNPMSPVYVIADFQQKAAGETALIGSKSYPFEIIHSHFATLYQDLTQAFLTSKSKLVFVTLRWDKHPCALWVFAEGQLKAEIPFGTKLSVLLSESSSLPLATPETIALNFLKDYLHVLRRQKSIFVLTKFEEPSLIMAAVIRSLTGTQHIYGKPHGVLQKKALKTFDFLTHDLPDSTLIDLGDLYTTLSPLLEQWNLYQMMPLRYSQQIKLWMEKNNDRS